MNKRVQASHLEVGNKFYHDTEPDKVFKVVEVNLRYGKIKAKLIQGDQLSEKNYWFSRGSFYYRLITN